MSNLDDYARDFLRKPSIGKISTPHLLARTEERIAEIEAARPGFGRALRDASLLALDSSDENDLLLALSALAAVGESKDVPRLHALAETGSGDVARDARTAAFQIAHRRY